MNTAESEKPYEFTDKETARLELARKRYLDGSLNDKTPESKRLEFVRKLYEAGKIGSGDTDIQTLNIVSEDELTQKNGVVGDGNQLSQLEVAVEVVTQLKSHFSDTYQARAMSYRDDSGEHPTWISKEQLPLLIAAIRGMFNEVAYPLVEDPKAEGGFRNGFNSAGYAKAVEIFHNHGFKDIPKTT